VPALMIVEPEVVAHSVPGLCHCLVCLEIVE
jgi:hypothetical protein